MTRRVTKPPSTPAGPLDRVHLALGSKLVLSAEGRFGIVALIVLVIGLVALLGGLHWTLH